MQRRHHLRFLTVSASAHRPHLPSLCLEPQLSTEVGCPGHKSSKKQGHTPHQPHSGRLRHVRVQRPNGWRPQSRDFGRHSSHDRIVPGDDERRGVGGIHQRAKTSSGCLTFTILFLSPFLYIMSYTFSSFPLSFSTLLAFTPLGHGNFSISRLY